MKCANISNVFEDKVLGFLLSTNPDLTDAKPTEVDAKSYDEATHYMNWEKTLDVDSLQPNTTYYYRAYMYDGYSYCYGEVKSFTIPDTHEYVDLGLPSGTLWATCNIGADNPEEYGDYFAWGETSPKANYDEWNYKYWNLYYVDNDVEIYKYNTDSGYGTVDNKMELDLSDDAAYVNWGSGWRMPSKAQCVELFNSSYTTTTWTTQNGVYGRKITSRKNGNSLFLPAAGGRYHASLGYAGSNGHFWSRTLNADMPYYGWYLGFGSSGWGTFYYSRYSGLSVRPVRASQN